MSGDQRVAVFGEGVSDIFNECQRMIGEARQWISGTKWWSDCHVDPATPDGKRFYQRQVDLVNEMELSYYRGLY